MRLEKIKKILEELDQENITFDSHFYKRAKNRPIKEGLIRSYISNLKRLKIIEKGKIENRFKLWFKMSRKYSLVVIIEISTSKHLKIISAWNSNKKWQRKLKK